MFKTIYEVKAHVGDSGVFLVYREGKYIGEYEVSSDGCRCFGVGENDADYYLGHTNSQMAAQGMIEKAYANIIHFCSLKGGN
jgi:hypothetical protein